MPLRKFQFQPGINKEGSDYSNEGGWFDADKVRFRKGRPEKIGGWSKYTGQGFIGTCRKIYVYRSAEQTDYSVLGTHQKLYVLEGDDFNDITPIRATTTNGIVFAATNGSAIITATDDDHGAVVGDFLTIAGAVSLGGTITAAVLNTEHQITSITTDTFTFVASATANGSDTGNGGSGADAAYQINTGLDVYVRSTGWGVGTFGSSTWGSAAGITSTNQLRLWSIDNFGDDTIAATRLGGVYYWDESAGVNTRAVDATTLSNASNVPTKVLQIMMSDVDRHVIAFGSNAIGSSILNPLLVRFSDAESLIDWTPSSTNSAGGVQLSLGSVIIGALRTRQEILIWTDAGIVSMRFVGQPFIFSFNEVATGMSMISPNAAVNANGQVFFMDRGSFYTYSGSAQRLPCTVLDYIFSDINKSQLFKIFGTSNPEHNEVMWFYPSEDSTEINRYVIYNYLEQTWSIGTTTDNFTRTAWNDAPTRVFPLATSKDDDTNINYLYNHELGHGSDGENFTAFIESSDFDLDPDGERYMFVSKIIPDLTFRDQQSTTDDVTFTIKGRNYPLENLSTLSTISVTPDSTFTNTRARSRQCAIRVSNSSNDYGWRLGDLRLDIKPDGRR